VENNAGWSFLYDRQGGDGPATWRSPEEAGSVDCLFAQSWYFDDPGIGPDERSLS